MTLREAYRRSDYRAGLVTARIGRRSATGDAWLLRHRAREAAFITACNPLSRLHPAGWNRHRQEALLVQMRRHTMDEGVSGHRRWQELNLLVAADARVLMHAAIRFRQVAILRLRLGQPARLICNPRLIETYRKR